MKNCRTCNHEISPKAKRCRNCGAPQNTSGQNAIAIAIVFIIAVVWISKQF